MRVHELTELKKQEGIIFEITGMTAHVARYAKPYGKYIKDKLLAENVRLDNYMTNKEIVSFNKVSMKTLVRRAAKDICPEEKDIYFEIF